MVFGTGDSEILTARQNYFPTGQPQRIVMGAADHFQIRSATVDDAALLSEVAARLFDQAFGAVNEPEDMREYLATAFSPDVQAAELSDAERRTFIALDDAGSMIGYAMVRRGTRAPGVIAASPGELQRIYVDRPWHGRHVADALMTTCVEQARAWACDVLWLGVFQENPRAIAFYRRSGFVTVGVQTFMLGRDLQHDFVMARSLA
jgi:ribosomal protein S18 acetylase RimI-like enzyme